MELFETALRQKMRFVTAKGELNAEQIWDLSLNELDVAARTINNDLKSVTEDSFIKVEPDPRARHLALALDVLKRVIEVKMEEQEERKNAAARKERREKLIKALANKEEDSLAKMSEKRIREELEALS